MNSFRTLYKVLPFGKKLSNHVQKYNFFRCYSSKYNLDISDPAVQKYFEYIKTDYWDLKTRLSLTRKESSKLAELLPIVEILEARMCVVDNLKNLEELKEEDGKDKDMIALVKEERDIYTDLLKDLDKKLISSLFDKEVSYSSSDTIVEVTAGVGGQEAMLFARELLEMYVGYAKFRQWECVMTQEDLTDIGGLRKGYMVLSGPSSFQEMAPEAGVHRVQRVPATEKGGRLHTSTVSVAVLLQPTEIEVSIPDRDVHVETKRATGAGGQHVNTTDSAVRVVHIPTGLYTECQTERDQHKNKKRAMDKLRAMVYQQQSDKQDQEERALRKSQVGSGFRNEKIRTYNYNQDRVTDHRVSGAGEGGTVRGLQALLLGGGPLHAFLSQVRRALHRQKVLQEIEAIRNMDSNAKEKLQNK